jgi:hypothetical protein
MANTTKSLPRDGTWTELTGGGVPATSFSFDNQGPASIYVQYNKTVAPAAAEFGTLFKPGQGDRLVTLQRVWARVEFPDATIGSPASVFCNET